MKRISLEALLRTMQDQSYQEQYEYIRKLLEEEKIKPVKASRTNGKKPALYREYWILEEKKDYSEYIEEIKYNFSTRISVDYYLTHPDVYETDRPWVLLLNEYLKEHKDALKTAESLNGQGAREENTESMRTGLRIFEYLSDDRTVGILHSYKKYPAESPDFGKQRSFFQYAKPFIERAY